MSISIYATIDTTDANTILCQYNKKTDDVEILFQHADDVMNNGKEAQFLIDFQPAMIEWCSAIIKNDEDYSGIFEHFIQEYASKGGLISQLDV